MPGPFLNSMATRGDGVDAMTTIAALIVAAGRGTRAGTGEVPKQYVEIAGRPLLAHTLGFFLGDPRISYVKVVRRVEDAHYYRQAIMTWNTDPRLLPEAIGGKERQDSVRLGLSALDNFKIDFVLIHDAARPFLSRDMLDRLLEKMETSSGAILASKVTDTLKKADRQDIVSTTVPRENLWRAETPQAFRYKEILEIHRSAERSKLLNFTDDAALAEWAGMPIALVDSGGGNLKITTPADFDVAETRLRGSMQTPFVPDIRTGQGFDVHRFKPGDHVWICGVKIAHSQGIDAHSDGDVGLHALTDALLGTIADADIGAHFKNSDQRWRGASSELFVRDARRRIENAGGRISNVDLTILCEAPRIGPHRDEMRGRMSDMLGIAPGRISVKATTTETLGFTGRREGLAALATATVILGN